MVPNSLPATTGVTAIPTSGVYVKDLSVEVFGYGYAMVTGTVFDFADL